MQPPKSKDHFAILGVEPTATPEEIRKAYLDRAREIHPDRFDLNTQPVEWRRANDELALLNEAYAALRDAAGWASDGEPERGRHESADGWPQGWDPTGAEDTSPEPPPFDLGEMTAGEASFDQLPRSAQARLLARQSGLTQDQWSIRLRNPLFNGAGIAVLLCWFLYLFSQVDRSEWAFNTLVAYTVATTGVGMLMGLNVMSLLRWLRSTLKPALYLTPLYLIRTGFDVVSFFPIWTLGSISSIESRRAFSFGGRQLRVELGPHVETLRFASRRGAEAFELRLRAFERGLRQALDGKRFDYLRENDDFFSVRRQPRSAWRRGSRWGEYSAFVLPLLASWVFFALAADLNMKWVQERLIRYPESLSAPPMSLPRGKVGSVDRPDPVSPGVALAPVLESQGDGPPGSSVPFSGFSASQPPAQGQTPLPVPPGEEQAAYQDWKEFLPGPLAPDGSEGSLTYRFREVPQAPTPVNGHLTRYHAAGEAIAPMEINLRDAGRNLYFILEEWESRRTVLTVFVRGGQTVRFNVPLGAYRMKYAAGEKWYGESHLFGAGTVYGASRDRMDFTLEGDKVTSRKVEISLKTGASEDGRAQTE